MEFELADNWDEEAIAQTLHLMNKVIMPTEDRLAIVKSAAAYELPHDDADVETLTEDDVQRARLAEVVVKGKLNYVQWYGSMSLRGFGFRVFNACFLQPERGTAESLFIPVETIDLHIAA